MFYRCYVCDITNDPYLSCNHIEATRGSKNALGFTKTKEGFICDTCKKEHDRALKGYDYDAIRTGYNTQGS